ncbi:hypothetical protein L1281_000861 [Neisseria sp. HSC-16F19]|nr:DUF4190 domain-containing protein [Neisseria sp. HSC-16F19]MCP2040279.1 hypothetical protein [Neisseria sp. HSC-16F19]
MAKLKLGGRQTSKQSSSAGNTPAWISLIAGVLSWVVLPVIASLVAIISGHRGRKKAREEGAPHGVVALIGLVLGYLSLLLVLLAVVALLMLPGLLEEVIGQVEMEQSAAVQTATVPQNVPADGSGGVEAINAGKLWVAARMSKGMTLNEITEDFPLDEAQRQYWQQIRIYQGTIEAVPVGGREDQPMILLSMQGADNKLVWVCAGTVPEFAEAACQ